VERYAGKLAGCALIPDAGGLAAALSYLHGERDLTLTAACDAGKHMTDAEWLGGVASRGMARRSFGLPPAVREPRTRTRYRLKQTVSGSGDRPPGGDQAAAKSGRCGASSQDRLTMAGPTGQSRSAHAVRPSRMHSGLPSSASTGPMLTSWLR
jgi:hypothetical protein